MSGCAHALAGTQNRNWKPLVVQAKRERIKEVSLYVTMENTFQDFSFTVLSHDIDGRDGRKGAVID